MRVSGKSSAGLAAAVMVMAATLAATPTRAEPPTTKCEMRQVASLPVTVDRNRTHVMGAINGQPVKFAISTASVFDGIGKATAEKLGLESKEVPYAKGYVSNADTDFYKTRVQLLETDAEHLTLGNIAAPNTHFLVLPETSSHEDEDDAPDGILGEAILGNYDIEFDLPHARMAFYTPQQCDGVDIAPWDSAYSVVDFLPLSAERLHPMISVLINGHPARAIVSTNSSYSVIDKTFAASLGITPDSPNVTVAPTLNDSDGNPKANVWIGVFDSITIGDETIKRPRLRFSDNISKDRPSQATNHPPTPPDTSAQIILGGDFVRSHRVLLSHSQKKLYFSYAGGPVFQTGVNNTLVKDPATTGQPPQ